MSSSFVLPESFLEEARNVRPTFIAKNGVVRFLPFIGGGSVDAGVEGGEGDVSGESEEQGEAEEHGEEGQESDDEGEGLPESVKEILRKNRAAAKAAERKLQQANKRAEAAEQKAKSYEDRDKTELEKANERAATAEQKLAEVLQQNKRMSLRSAFLGEGSISWVDPDDAVEMAMSKYGLSEVEVSDTGMVDKAALKAIAKVLSKEKPYLVKQEDSKQGPSGGAFNGNKGGKPGAEKAGLTKKYPALRGRQQT